MKKMILFLIIIIPFIYCKKKSTNKKVPSKAITRIKDQSLLQEAYEPQKKWSIAFVNKWPRILDKDFPSQYWQKAWQGTYELSKNLNIYLKHKRYEVEFKDIYTSSASVSQIKLIEEIIESGEFQGIILGASDSNLLSPVVSKAVSKNIAIITLDTPVNNELVYAHVAFDNFKAGKALGELVARKISKGKVIVLSGPVAEQNANERAQGFIAGLQLGQIEILEYEDIGWGDDDKPTKSVKKYLEKYKDLDAIMCPNDLVAVNHVIPLLSQTNRKSIIVTGFDANIGLQAIRDGNLYATVHQPIDKMGALALNLILRKLDNQNPINGIISYPKIPIVTRENIHEFN